MNVRDVLGRLGGLQLVRVRPRGACSGLTLGGLTP